MQFLAAYIMKGRMQAATVASTVALLSLLFPPLSLISSATIALVTLRLGGMPGLYTLAISCVSAAIMSAVLLGEYQFALVYGSVMWLPVWLIANILRESRQLALAMEVAVLLGVAAVVAIYIFQTDPAGIWRDMLNLMMQPVLQSQPDIPKDVVQQSAEVFSHYMTGVMAAGGVFGLLLGLFLARYWQANLYNPGGFQTEYLQLKGHKELAIVTVIIFGLALFANLELSWNVLVVLFVFYTFTGAAVLHNLIAPINGGRYWLIAFYTLLFILPQCMILVSICGLLDTWLNLRNKFKPKGV